MQLGIRLSQNPPPGDSIPSITHWTAAEVRSSEVMLTLLTCACAGYQSPALTFLDTNSAIPPCWEQLLDTSQDVGNGWEISVN